MNDSNIGRERVLSALLDRAPRAMHLMEVVGALELPKSRRDEVLDVLEELVERGLIRSMPGNRFRVGRRKTQRSGDPQIGGDEPPKRRSRERASHEASSTTRNGVPAGGTSGGAKGEEGPGLSGWLSVHPRGFGFVAAEDGGPDVFVPGGAMADALHGDRVRVRAQSSPKGREGEVVEVLRRGLARIAGVLRRRGRGHVVEPGDPRLPERFVVEGTLPLGIEADEEVIAQVEHYPDARGEGGRCRVLSSLGARGSAAALVEKICLHEGLTVDPDDDAIAEAQAYGTRVKKSDIADREDLRDLPLCTIDPPDARDHDDALFAERDGDGYRVIIAIADVSHYVLEGSALDRSARERGCSVYLPDRVIPMLPHELSSNLASLVPDEDRLTLAVEVHLGPRGAVRGYRFIEGVMRSKGRLFYEGVAEVLGLSEGAEPQPEAKQHRDMLEVLMEISEHLRRRRKRRGALEFELPEAKVILDREGEPANVVRTRGEPGLRRAYALVEDLMLLANEVVAEVLTKKKVPAIFRVHGAPNEEKLEIFAKLARSLGHDLDDDEARKPKSLSRFLAKVADSPQGSVLNYLLLRAMQQASYGVDNIGHFALAAEHYLHFTSPIRRYPDLAVHRVVRALAREERFDRRRLREALTVQAAEASRLERRAMGVERDVVALYRAILMKDRVGESFEATVNGVAEHGVYVSFDEPFVEARCPISELGDDYYELDELGVRLTGSRSGHRYSLGDRLRVRLTDVSVERRELTAIPEAHLGDDAQSRPRRGERGADRGRGGAVGRGKKRGEGDGRRAGGKEGEGRKGGAKKDAGAEGRKTRRRSTKKSRSR